MSELTESPARQVLSRRRARTVTGRLVRNLLGFHWPLTLFAVLMVVGAAASLLGLGLDHRVLAGDPIWAKPLKFNLSLAVYSITLALFIGLMPRGRLRRAAWWAGTVGAVSSLLEITIITVQVVRGTSSHFNISTAFDRTMYLLMGAGVVFLYTATLVVAVLIQFSPAVRDRSLRLAIRVGVAISLGGLSVGFLMVLPTSAQLASSHPTAIGSHSVGGDDPTGGLPLVGWNSLHGDLRVAHFVGMHAMQAVPVVAILLSVFAGRRLNLATRVRLVMLFSALYAAVFALSLWQALRGQSIARPDGVTFFVAAVLIVAIVGCFAVIQRRGSVREQRS